MSALRPKLIRTISKVVSLVPDSALAAVETGARLGRGKGWGAATVEQEVAACPGLLGNQHPTSPVALDVGANVGSRTTAMLASSASATVYCFEPSAAAFESLVRQLEGSSRVYLQNLAVGREAGCARLWSDQPGSGLGSLTKRRLDHFGVEFSHSEEVQVTSLDK